MKRLGARMISFMLLTALISIQTRAANQGSFDCAGASDQEICKEALKKGMVDATAIGGVACCNGRKIVCTYPQNVPPSFTPPAECAGAIMGCVEAHEGYHRDKDACLDASGLSATGAGGNSPGEAECKSKRSECFAHRVQLACLDDIPTTHSCYGSPILKKWRDAVQALIESGGCNDAAAKQECCQTYRVGCDDKKW